MSKVLIAVLDEHDVLIGTKKVSRVPDGAVVLEMNMDLPTDGTYRWDRKQQAFFPLGHGYEKPIAAPTSYMHVTYLLAQIVLKKKVEVPDEVRAWCRWYEQEMLARDREEAERQRRKGPFFRNGEE